MILYNRKLFNPYIQIFFMILSLSLIILYVFKYRYAMIDLEDLYNDFYEDDVKLDGRMLFNIDIDGCSIRGSYQGDSFREVTSVGDHRLNKCKRYNYKVGQDPDEYVNKLVGSDFASEMQRRKIKYDERLENDRRKEDN